MWNVLKQYLRKSFRIQDQSDSDNEEPSEFVNKKIFMLYKSRLDVYNSKLNIEVET